MSKLQVMLSAGTMKDKKYKEMFTVGKVYDVVGDPIVGRAPEPQVVVVSDTGRLLVLDAANIVVVVVAEHVFEGAELTVLEPLKVEVRIPGDTAEDVAAAETATNIAKLEAGLGKE